MLVAMGKECCWCSLRERNMAKGGVSSGDTLSSLDGRQYIEMGGLLLGREVGSVPTVDLI